MLQIKSDKGEVSIDAIGLPSELITDMLFACDALFDMLSQRDDLSPLVSSISFMSVFTEEFEDCWSKGKTR